MKHALHAEWTKLRTASGSGLLVAAAVALTVAVSAAVAAGVTYTGGTGQYLDRHRGRRRRNVAR